MTDSLANVLPEPPTTAPTIPAPTIDTPEPLLGGNTPAVAPVVAPFAALADADITALFGDYAPTGDALKNVQTTFAELELGKDKAERLTTLYTSMQKEAEQATAAAWNDTVKTWQDQSRAHPDFGGANFDTSLAQAKQLVIDYGDAPFQEMLAMTGVGNHPAMIAFILKVAKALPGEAAPAQTQQTSAPRSLASILFPSTEKK